MIRMTKGQLRSIIREAALSEDFLHGVPEWQLRKDTADFVETLRDRITSYVLINKSENGVDRAEAIRAMNDVCDELENKVYDVLEDALFSFTRRV